MSFASILSLTLLAGAAVGRPPSKFKDLRPDMLPEIKPGIDQQRIEDGLNENLPFTNYTIDFFTKGEIPEDCKREAEQRNYISTDFDVFKVYYEDCDQPWIMCREKDADAEVDADEMATNFGKMPLGMREFIKHVMVVRPEGLPGASAINYMNTIIIAANSYHLRTFAHEISHSLDWDQEVPGVTPEGMGGLSDSDHWREEYSKDNAAVSSYARTKWCEKVCCTLVLNGVPISIWLTASHLADTGPIALFHNVVPNGGLHTLPDDPYNEVYHAFATYISAYRDIITPRSKPRCNNKKPDSPLIHVIIDHHFVTPQVNHTIFKIGTT
ncbi:hypothetical protein GGR53DRAFT_526292 [Hypoxylon sp. FL1150]|nr:hypothetical protein GGR53DRAFT_526292 [Hypoxylon sp. FL1150]